MFVAVEIRGPLLNRHRFDAWLDLSVVTVCYTQLVFRDHCDLVVREIDDFVRVSNQGRGVAGDEVFVLAHADDERTAESRGNQYFRKVSEENHQPVGASQLGERPSHGFNERFVLARSPGYFDALELLRD